MASDRLQRRLERLLDEAEEAITQLEWRVVHDRAQAVLAIDPGNSDGIAFLATAERALSVSSSDIPSSPQQVDSTVTQSFPPSFTAPEAERRQLTVMFCDLQGSTALSQQLDPEELRDVIRSYQDVCAGAVARFDGYIAKYLGDGLLIYFGYPQAHEDDPQRAIRSGLAIIEAMSALNDRLRESGGLELAVRIGIHTGLVVAGEMGGGDTVEELAIVGETPNIAARLQEAAEPNSVVISNITASLVQGFFVCNTRGFHYLKGISDALELFAVLSESGAQTRFDVAAGHLTPLVGRAQEVGLLLDRWEQAQEGLGQVVLVSGEAGIGKSRLIDALTEELADDSYSYRRLRCSAYHQNSALHPVLEYLQGWLGFAREDSAEERLAKLESSLANVDFPLAEAVTLLSALLSVPLAERYHPLAMSPETQSERTRELLVSLMLYTAEDQLVFLVIEDLHWADPSTIAVLGLLLDQVPTAKALALLSFRPEFTPPWQSRAYVTPILLSRLTRRLAGEMVDRLTGGKTLPDEVLTQVAAKSDGIPIFVEELTRMLLESDLLNEVGDHYELTGPLAPLAIPTTLQDSLTARLDRLSSAREVAQLGAVLGREFTYELIKAVSPLDEELLGSHLQQLVNAEFLYQKGLPPDANYTFKHALIQDTAYESLLRSRRQQHHQRTAEVLAEGSANIVETHPELLAHHFAEAGLTERAVNYWLRAGERALASYGYEEAHTHFEKGLVGRGITLSGTEAACDEEAADLLFGLGQAQAATLQWYQLDQAVSILRRAFDYYADAGEVARAVAIAEYPVPTPPGLPSGAIQLISQALALVPVDSQEASRLLCRYGQAKGQEEGDYQSAQTAFSQAVNIARKTGDASLETRALGYAAQADFYLFNWSECLEKALRVIDLGHHTNELQAQVMAHYSAMYALHQTGELERARQHSDVMLEEAERLRDRFWLATALSTNGIVSQLGGDWQASRNFSDRGLEVSPLDPRILSCRALLEYEVGNYGQGQVYLEAFMDALTKSRPGPTAVYSYSAIVLQLVARITGLTDHLAVAETAAETVLSSPSVNLLFSTRANAGLALAAVLRAEIGMATTQYAALKPVEGTMLASGFAAVDRLLGLLIQTIGDMDKAVAHFDDALAFCRKAGYRPELAKTCCDYADMLQERDADGDRAKAMSLLDESLAISSELGMRPLMERVLSRREILRA